MDLRSGASQNPPNLEGMGLEGTEAGQSSQNATKRPPTKRQDSLDDLDKLKSTLRKSVSGHAAASAAKQAAVDVKANKYAFGDRQIDSGTGHTNTTRGRTTTAVGAGADPRD